MKKSLHFVIVFLAIVIIIAMLIGIVMFGKLQEENREKLVDNEFFEGLNDNSNSIVRDDIVVEFAENYNISISLSWSLDRALKMSDGDLHQKFTIEEVQDFSPVDDWEFGKVYRLYLNDQKIYAVLERDDLVYTIRDWNDFVK